MDNFDIFKEPKTQEDVVALLTIAAALAVYVRTLVEEELPVDNE